MRAEACMAAGSSVERFVDLVGARIANEVDCLIGISMDEADTYIYPHLEDFLE